MQFSVSLAIALIIGKDLAVKNAIEDASSALTLQKDEIILIGPLRQHSLTSHPGVWGTLGATVDKKRNHSKVGDIQGAFGQNQ